MKTIFLSFLLFLGITLSGTEPLIFDMTANRTYVDKDKTTIRFDLSIQNITEPLTGSFYCMIDNQVWMTFSTSLISNNSFYTENTITIEELRRDVSVKFYYPGNSHYASVESNSVTVTVDTLPEITLEQQYNLDDQYVYLDCTSPWIIRIHNYYAHPNLEEHAVQTTVTASQSWASFYVEEDNLTVNGEFHPSSYSDEDSTIEIRVVVVDLVTNFETEKTFYFSTIRQVYGMPDTITVDQERFTCQSHDSIILNDVGFEVFAIMSDPPQHGQLNLNANGTFEYFIYDNYVGEDSFTYFAVDRYWFMYGPITVTLNVIGPQPE